MGVSLSSRAAFVLMAVGPAIRERPRAEERTDMKPAVEEAMEKAMPEVKKRRFNHTLQSEAEYEHNLPGAGIIQGPPWSTCSVEYQDGNRNVLEEWIMRGESDTLKAFRNFRNAATGKATNLNVRCEDTAPVASDGVTCLECLMTSDSVSQGPRVVETFGTLQQCFALTVGGTGFCRSGGVAVML